MKAQKLKFLETAKRAGLFTLARARSASAIRILCYHGIWLGDDKFSGDAMFMRAEAFKRRLSLIRQWGYPVISLDDALSAFAHKITPPKNAVVITIDDGWYGTYTEMAPALAAAGMPATLYCDTANLQSGQIVLHVLARYLLEIARADPSTHAYPDEACTALVSAISDRTKPYSDRLQNTRALAQRLRIDLAPYEQNRAFAYMTPNELVAAHRAGLDVQLHTHNHTLHDMSDARISAEITANQNALSDILGSPQSNFRHFCYPSGVTTTDAARILSGIGLASSTTTVQGLAWSGMNHHLLPRLLDNERLTELEFEAELSGFADQMRRAGSTLARIRSVGSRTTQTSSAAPAQHIGY
jgi:peptidoglycan/xylan/chitin deacetylase (PgdA/CDA1 family)